MYSTTIAGFILLGVSCLFFDMNTSQGTMSDNSHCGIPTFISACGNNILDHVSMAQHIIFDNTSNMIVDLMYIVQFIIFGYYLERLYDLLEIILHRKRSGLFRRTTFPKPDPWEELFSKGILNPKIL